MPYNTVNSYFHASSRRNRHSKQTQSWHYQNSSSINVNENSPRRPKISFNLFSIISKFEALDAISLPIKMPSLQPAPLQLSRNNSRRQTGTRASQIKRLSTIFSPRDRSTEYFADVGSNDESTSVEELSIAKESVGAGASARRHGKGKLRKSPPSARADARKSFKAFRYQDHGSGDTVIAMPERGEGGWKRRRTIKDMIKFYDGSMNEVLAFRLLSTTDIFFQQQYPQDIIQKRRHQYLIHHFRKPHLNAGEDIPTASLVTRKTALARRGIPIVPQSLPIHYIPLPPRNGIWCLDPQYPIRS